MIEPYGIKIVVYGCFLYLCFPSIWYAIKPTSTISIDIFFALLHGKISVLFYALTNTHKHNSKKHVHTIHSTHTYKCDVILPHHLVYSNPHPHIFSRKRRSLVVRFMVQNSDLFSEELYKFYKVH